ncbi:MAG TPA: hypothetical protein PK587_12430 [Syntrophales bacterium]|nr:hypothetical protein [Syntrophales bacterium]
MRKAMISLSLIAVLTSLPPGCFADMPTSAGELAAAEEQIIVFREMTRSLGELARIQGRILQGIPLPDRDGMLRDLTDLEGRMDRLSLELSEIVRDLRSRRETLRPRVTEPRMIPAGAVTVKVSRVAGEGAVLFKVSLSSGTAGVENYKLKKTVLMRADGREYRPRVRAQTSSLYRMSAILEFENPGVETMELVIRNIGGVKERIFRF